ncbi:MAG: hypothetical protein Q9160_008537 [Pyrenula sp. 1 TL-2023]
MSPQTRGSLSSTAISKSQSDTAPTTLRPEPRAPPHPRRNPTVSPSPPSNHSSDSDFVPLSSTKPKPKPKPKSKPEHEPRSSSDPDPDPDSDTALTLSPPFSPTPLQPRLAQLTLERNEWRASALKFRDMAKEAGGQRAKLAEECDKLMKRIKGKSVEEREQERCESEEQGVEEGEEESLEGLLEENRVLREELEEANGRVGEMEEVNRRYREAVGVWLGILKEVGVAGLDADDELQSQEDALQIADRVDGGMGMDRAFEEVMMARESGGRWTR